MLANVNLDFGNENDELKSENAELKKSLSRSQSTVSSSFANDSSGSDNERLTKRPKFDKKKKGKQPVHHADDKKKGK